MTIGGVPPKFYKPWFINPGLTLQGGGLFPSLSSGRSNAAVASPGFRRCRWLEVRPLPWKTCQDPCSMTIGTLSRVGLLPQKRERLVFWHESQWSLDLPSCVCVCVMWRKVAASTLQRFEVFTNACDHWLDEYQPSAEVLKMYFRPANMPRPAVSYCQAKR